MILIGLENFVLYTSVILEKCRVKRTVPKSTVLIQQQSRVVKFAIIVPLKVKSVSGLEI